MSENREYLASTKYTKTSALLLPTVGVAINLILDYGFINAFLGDKSYSNVLDTPCIYLLFNSKINNNFESFAEMTRELDNFHDEYDPEDDHVMFVLKVNEKWYDVIEKFKQGKYTGISREYVSKYFPPRVCTGTDAYGTSIWKPSKNYMILTGSDYLRSMIEQDLNVTLNPNAEVFSKPDEKEIYGRQEKSRQVRPAKVSLT